VGIGTVISENQKLNDLKVKVKVPKTTLEDQVELLKPFKREGSSLLCESISVGQESPFRIKSDSIVCPHFSECGGCQLQMLNYDSEDKFSQIIWKTRNVKAALQPSSDILIHPTIPSKFIWHYRNKMEFSFSSDREGNQFLGLFSFKGNSRIVDIDSCKVAPVWVSKALVAIRAWWKRFPQLEAYVPFKNIGELESVTFRDGLSVSDRLIRINLAQSDSLAMASHEWKLNLQASLKNLCGSLFLMYTIRRPKHPTTFRHEILFGTLTSHGELTIRNTSVPYVYEMGSFLQPNTQMMPVIYEQVIKLIESRLVMLSSKPVVADLFSGIGLIGLSITKIIPQCSIVSVECIAEAVTCARRNFSLNQVENRAQVFEDDATKASSFHVWKDAEVVIVDPPRSGLSNLAKALNQSNVHYVIYVSCNPESQGKDLAQLSNFKCEEMIPIDQFPHTAHMENIVILNNTNWRFAALRFLRSLRARFF
jgi:23S rRNA (uracil1939-C5)-methyltransferase